MSAENEKQNGGGANSAGFTISIDGSDPAAFTVTCFRGEDAISTPYCFDIDFEHSDSSQSTGKKAAELTAGAVLGKLCIFKLLRDGGDGVGDSGGGGDNRGGSGGNGIGGAAYCGVIREFRAAHRAKPVYSIRVVAGIELLSLNVNSMIFQKLTVVDIIKKVIQKSGVDKYCNFKYQCRLSYPLTSFCVQHRETDLNFISRLMEQNGIWYFFENSGGKGEKDSVIVTDAFSDFSAKPVWAPFDENSGFSGASKRSDGEGYGNGFGEFVYALSSRSAIIPQSVKVSAQNYRTPENDPEGARELEEGGGVWGCVREFGGNYKNTDEANRGADLYMKRLKIENTRTDGKSVCKAFRAGRRIRIGADEREFLLVSVTHEGGSGKEGDGYAYTCKNAFSCIDAGGKVYAPPLRAVPPRAGGVTTARVEALGEDHPTIDEMGRYRVRMPFDGSQTEDYGATKDIRVAQPSGGENYGVHFPSKAGAEMALAYVNEDPDKPIGLGFVPNAGAPSAVNNMNRDQNIIRTWGGNELVMDDTPCREKITLSTVGKNSSDDGGDKASGRLKSLTKKIKDAFQSGGEERNCELSLDNENMKAALRAWKHGITMICDKLDRFISLSTGGQNEIRIDDTLRKITMETLMGCAVEIDELNDTIALSNAYPAPRNGFCMDGKKKKITVKTAGGCQIEMDDKNNTVTVFDNGKVNRVVLDGKGKALSLESKGDIRIAASGNVTIDSEKEISIGSKKRMLIKSGKELDMKGKTRMAISGPSKLDVVSKRTAVIKGKTVKIN